MRPHLILCLILVLIAKSNAQNSTASAQVSSFNLEAPQLKSSKKIWIYVPKSYADTNKKYSVIYMHDAQNLFDKSTSYAGEWQVDETLDSLKANVIVVGIEHGNEKRLDELTPYPNKKHGGGNADAYLDFIVNTLKPHIDQNYRTRKTKKHTAIIGSSLGGLVSYYAVLKYPKIFGKAVVFSPSFWFSDQIYKLTEQTDKINAQIYFAAGDNEDQEMLPDLDKMYELVKSKHCNPSKKLQKVVIAGGQHNEKLWRDSFAKAYLWLFK